MSIRAVAPRNIGSPPLPFASRIDRKRGRLLYASGINFRNRGLSSGIWSLLIIQSKTFIAISTRQRSLAGSAIRVNHTCWRLPPVGARWAASNIISRYSTGTGLFVKERFECLALQSDIICLGEGIAVLSIQWIFSIGNEECIIALFGHTTAQCPHLMHNSIFSTCGTKPRSDYGQTLTHLPHCVQVLLSIFSKTLIGFIFLFVNLCKSK